MQPRRDLLVASHLSPPLPSKLEMHPTRDDYQVKSQSRLHENSTRLYFRKFRKMRDVKRKLKKKILNVQYGWNLLLFRTTRQMTVHFPPFHLKAPLMYMCAF